MGDKFVIHAGPGELSAAETLLGNLARNIEEEGAKLGALPGKAASWSGGTAKTLKAEMTRLSEQMAKSAPHFTTAQTAVATFRGKVEDALNRAVPDLNRRWNESISTYDSAVIAANNAYGASMRPFRHMPPEDQEAGGKEFRATRDRAVSAAAGARDGTQRQLQGEFDQLMTDLRTAATTCGTALNGAVLAAVPAEIVSRYLAGGGMGTGMLDRDFDKSTAGTRQALTGDDSLAGRADDLRAGEEFAATLPLGRNEQLTPEQIATLKANGGNPAFVQGLLGKLGPSGTAALAYQTRNLYGSQDGGKRNAGKEQLAALSLVLATGSHVKVDDGSGHERYLMDDGWLQNFNPKDAWGGKNIPPDFVEGYRPDLLLPFMQGKGFSENFTGIVAEQALKDYEAFRNMDNLGNSDVYQRYMLYRGNDSQSHDAETFGNVATGNRDNPFRTDMWHIVFERVADHPGVSNKVLMGHFDAMMDIYTGKDANLTGGEAGTYNWLGTGDPNNPGGPLNEMLKQATLGIPASDQALGDSLLSRIGVYLDKHPDDKFVNDALPALADIVTDDRYLGGQIYSVATPFSPAYAGYDPITGSVRDPRFGLLMPREVWAELQQEAMRRPEGVALVAASTQNWMTEYRAQYGNPGPGNDVSVTAIDTLELESVRVFLAQNVAAVTGDIEADLAKRLGDNDQARATAKAVAGKVFEWVTDPTKIATNITNFAGETAKKTVGNLIDWGIDQYYDASAEDIKKAYEDPLNALRDLGRSEIVHPTPWGDFQVHGNDLAVRYGQPMVSPDGQPILGADGRPMVYQPDPVTTNAYRGGPVQTYTGNPEDYVGKHSETVWTGSAPTTITDDFRTKDASGHVTGILPVGEMNHLQRQAYYEWIHDPATQKYLDAQEAGTETGRGRAGQEQPPR
jgi:hypothetical protein